MPAQEITHRQLATAQRAFAAYKSTIDNLDGLMVDDEEREAIHALADMFRPLTTVAGMGGTVTVHARTS